MKYFFMSVYSVLSFTLPPNYTGPEASCGLCVKPLQGQACLLGHIYEVRNKVRAIEEIDRRAIETKEIKVGFDPTSGFIGTKVTGALSLACTNFDKLLIFLKDGTYKVIPIPEKQYVDQVAHVGIADKKTVITAVYKTKEGLPYAKRFVVTQFILERAYRYIDEEGELCFLSPEENPQVILHFSAKAGQKIKQQEVALKEVPIKGAQAKGVRLSSHKVLKVKALD